MLAYNDCVANSCSESFVLTKRQAKAMRDDKRQCRHPSYYSRLDSSVPLRNRVTDNVCESTSFDSSVSRPVQETIAKTKRVQPAPCVVSRAKPSVAGFDTQRLVFSDGLSEAGGNASASSVSKIAYLDVKVAAFNKEAEIRSAIADAVEKQLAALIAADPVAFAVAQADTLAAELALAKHLSSYNSKAFSNQSRGRLEAESLCDGKETERSFDVSSVPCTFVASERDVAISNHIESLPLKMHALVDDGQNERSFEKVSTQACATHLQKAGFETQPFQSQFSPISDAAEFVVESGSSESLFTEAGQTVEDDIFSFELVRGTAELETPCARNLFPEPQIPMSVSPTVFVARVVNETDDQFPVNDFVSAHQGKAATKKNSCKRACLLVLRLRHCHPQPRVEIHLPSYYCPNLL